MLLVRSHLLLMAGVRDHVKQAVPSTWEPAALAKVALSCRFIKIFGTHIVGVKMRGKDVIYLKQQHWSRLQAVDVQKRLKETSDRIFLDANGQSDISCFRDAYGKDKLHSCRFYSWRSQNQLAASCGWKVGAA